MEIRLLGPVALVDGGEPRSAGGRLRLAVLALLAHDLGQVVPVERFFDLVWGATPPPQAKAALQGHISALRRMLDGSSFTLSTQAPGYRLTGDPDAVDAHRFLARLDRATRTPDPAAAVRQLREALDLWHGAALGGLPETTLRRALADPLDAAHRRATDLLASLEARLAAADRPAPAPVADSRTVPRQLPRAAVGFVGRTIESLRLDDACGPGPERVGLAVVVGQAGVGKTTMVARWAESAAEQFPDGQLFVDLRGFDPAGPADPGEVLGRFLQALGLPDPHIPPSTAERAALFRQRTLESRLLVVLDNAHDAAAVRMLVPSGAGCATVVTSRNSLQELVVTEGATLLHLDVLTPADSRDLLARMIGADRLEAEPRAADRLAELCHHLPLALRIASARLAAHPGWAIADLVVELDDEHARLAVLDTQGTVSVRSALTLTCRQLPEDARRLLPLLALHPGSEISIPAAAALLDENGVVARRALGSLGQYHLLAETSPSRYSRHDLVRLFSEELASALPPAEVAAARDRLLDFYLCATARGAHLLTASQHLANPPLAHPPRALPRLDSAHHANTWFTDEEPTILSLIRSATAEGDHVRAWKLADNSCLLAEPVSCVNRLDHASAGLAAARRSGDDLAESRLSRAFGVASAAAGHTDDGLARLNRALELADALGSPQERLSCLDSLAVGRYYAGDFEQAAHTFRASLDVARDLADRPAEGRALLNLSYMLTLTGRGEEALTCSTRSLALLDDLTHTPSYAHALGNHGLALDACGRLEEAEAGLTRGHALAARYGHQRAVFRNAFELGRILLRHGRPADARRWLLVAQEANETLRLPVVDVITSLLAKAEQAEPAEQRG
ncbi:AAA family ATPase [Kitasatospora sp. NPDC093102]|uniref:AfsR/SARP family transcriptional regulator n=1 Tax=Kitasatospora sp. NPDC093102 TaxID=3155069 RepID=UPI00343C7DCF